MSNKTAWCDIKDKGHGRPIFAITIINHYKGDASKAGYAVSLVDKDLDDARVWIKPTLFKAVLKLVLVFFKTKWTN